MSTGKKIMTYGYARNYWSQPHGNHIHIQVKHCCSIYFFCPGIRNCIHHIYRWWLVALPAVP